MAAEKQEQSIITDNFSKEDSRHSAAIKEFAGTSEHLRTFIAPPMKCDYH
jgi:hypothetical protein